ncbi:MAG: hypothetical protein ACR2KX_11770 [Chitinophagaceae bacterium]
MKRRIFILNLLITFSFITLPVLAQDTANAAFNNLPPEPDDSGSKIVSPLSRLEFILSITVLGFGLLIILLEIFLIKTNRISSEDSIKFIVITLIITSTLFLITAGYSNDQIAPAVGLLGTIAGYLLGRIQHSNQQENKNEKDT